MYVKLLNHFRRYGLYIILYSHLLRGGTCLSNNLETILTGAINFVALFCFFVLGSQHENYSTQAIFHEVFYFDLHSHICFWGRTTMLFLSDWLPMIFLFLLMLVRLDFETSLIDVL